MNTIIEQVIQLPKEEKIELYFALQEDLDFEDDQLSNEQWKQLDEITAQIDNGTLKKISEEEMMRLIKQRRNNV